MGLTGCLDCIGLVAALVADGLWVVKMAGQSLLKRNSESPMR